MQNSSSNTFSRRFSTLWPNGTASLFGVLASSVLAFWATAISGADETIPLLQVGSEVYSNVVVTSVTATDIYFTHLRGIGNAKLKRLDPELQKRFHFDPSKAAEKEQEQSHANAVFLDEFRKQPTPSAPKVKESQVVLVDVAEPVVEDKFYLLSQPKPPEIGEGMLGATVPTFDCSVDMTLQSARRTNGGGFSFQVETLRMSIGLSIATTLPTGFSPHLKEHEEGHKTINEHFYSLGRKSAERAGQAIFRTIFGVNLDDVESAEARARAMALSALQLEYWKYTRIPARAANAYYDELTDHGRNSTNSTVAVEQALERFEVKFPPELIESAAQPAADR